jgi:hypothetical protein
MFDTDVLIWVLRGKEKAAKLIESTEDRCLSIVSYMELLQGARDRLECRTIKSFLGDFAFRVLPLTENVGHRASIYMEEYALRSRMCVADALVAATAVENGVALCTADRKHYRLVKDLDATTFRP